MHDGKIINNRAQLYPLGIFGGKLLEVFIDSDI